jgi:hypothetical protein
VSVHLELNEMPVKQTAQLVQEHETWTHTFAGAFVVLRLALRACFLLPAACSSAVSRDASHAAWL